MFLIWVVVAILAGSALGAYTALFFGGKLSLVGLENPLAELRRPVEDTPQALHRLPWILGYMLTQLILLVVAVFLAYVVAILSAVIACVSFFFALVGLIAIFSGEPITLWLTMVLPCIVFGLVYCLSAFVGQDLLVGRKA